MKIERLIGIIFYLSNRERVTANQLAEHFEVSRRTIFRDINTLTLAGIPIYSGEALYHNTNSYCDKNLITANSASELDFAKDIITTLQVYPQDVIEAWYQYLIVGNPELFSDLMNTANQ